MEPDMEEALISSVQNHRPLWDPDDPLRKHIRIMKKIWELVADETGLTIPVAKRKWKNLRAYYVELLSKQNKLKIGDNASGNSAPSNWVHFEKMSFLKNVINKRSDVVDARGGPFKYHEDIRLKLDEGVSVSPIAWFKQEPVDVEDEEQPSRKIPTSMESNSMDEYKHLVELEKEKLKSIQEDKEDDEDLYFLKSLLPSLKKLSPIKKLMVRGDMLNCVLKALQEDAQSQES